jgi:hypothetical protein
LQDKSLRPVGPSCPRFHSLYYYYCLILSR